MSVEIKTIDGFIELDDENLLLEILTNLIENKIKYNNATSTRSI